MLSVMSETVQACYFLTVLKVVVVNAENLIIKMPASLQSITRPDILTYRRFNVLWRTAGLHSLLLHSCCCSLVLLGNVSGQWTAEDWAFPWVLSSLCECNLLSSSKVNSVSLSGLYRWHYCSVWTEPKSNSAPTHFSSFFCLFDWFVSK